MDPHREDEDEANAAVVLPDGFGSAEPLDRLAVVVSARGPELVKLFEQCGAHVVRPPYAALAGQAAPSSTTTPTNTTNPTPTTTTSNDAAPNGAAGGNGSASEAASKHSAEDNAAPTHFASDQAGSNTVSPNVSGETAEPDETVDDENLRAVVETIEACRSARARVVLVLPGDPLMAALSDALREHAARELAPHGIELIVADTRHPVQALAAVTVLDESANPRTEANRLAEAARAVLTGEVRQAIRRVTYAAGAVRAGDYFGYCTDDVRFTGRDACEVAGRLVAELAERTEDGPELITLVGGRGYTSIVEQMTEQLQQRYPEAEIVTVTGGAPGVVAAVGVE